MLLPSSVEARRNRNEIVEITRTRRNVEVIYEVNFEEFNEDVRITELDSDTREVIAISTLRTGSGTISARQKRIITRTPEVVAKIERRDRVIGGVFITILITAATAGLAVSFANGR